MASDLNQLCDEIKRLTDHVDRLEVDFLRCQEDILDLRKSKREMGGGGELTSRKEEVSKLRQKIEEVEEEKQRDTQYLRKKIESLEKQNRSLKKKVNQGQQNFTTMMHEVNQCKESNLTLVRMWNRLHVDAQRRKEKATTDDTTSTNTTATTTTIAAATTNPSAAAAIITTPAVVAATISTTGMNATTSTPSTAPNICDDIKESSEFHFSTSYDARILLVAGQKAVVAGYDSVLTPCDFMNWRTGVYTTPCKAKYQFRVRHMVNDRDYEEWHLCRSDGKRQLLKWRVVRGNGDFRFAEIVWWCEEGAGVWVEVVKVKGAKYVDCEFKGGIVD